MSVLAKSAICLLFLVGGTVSANADNPFYSSFNASYSTNNSGNYPRIIFQGANNANVYQRSNPINDGVGYQSTSLNPKDYPMGRPTLACVATIAASQGLPLDLMLGIQSVERGVTGGTAWNKNSSYDIGAFQVNSIHLPRIARLGGSEADLLHRGCYNARIAALLLSEALNNRNKSRLDYYSRASGYHSWTPSYNSIYRQKLVKYTGQWQAWLRNNQMGHLVSAPTPY